MSERQDRDTRNRDRLPDVRPSQAVGGYVHFLTSRERPQPARRLPEPDEPAWWEVDEPARLPDALSWRPGSVISSHLPLGIRSALDRNPATRHSADQNPWPTDEIGNLLGDSRYGTGYDLPAWTDSDLERERTSWREETGGARSGRKPRRTKRDRPDRQDRRGGAPNRGR